MHIIESDTTLKNNNNGAIKVRYNKRKLKANKNKILPIEFAKQAITSYSGMQLVKLYFEIIGLYHRIKATFRQFDFAGDYSIADIIVVMLLIKIIGLQRLSHIEFLKDDPLFCRISGLTRIPIGQHLLGRSLNSQQMQ